MTAQYNDDDDDDDDAYDDDDDDDDNSVLQYIYLINFGDIANK